MTDAGVSFAATRMLAALQECERELDRNNAMPSGPFAARADRLRRLLQTGRVPRIAIVGRRGAGKSSLLNAVAGADLTHIGHVEDTTRELRWRDAVWDGRAIEWLDTPGLRAAGRRGRRDQIERFLAVARPDVLLVLCQATEVDAGIDDDLADVTRLMRGMRAVWDEPPALFGVVTKVDELAPADVQRPPFEDDEKRANVKHAVSVLSAHMTRLGLAHLGVVPVNTYLHFSHGAIRDDLRWNVSVLAARVSAALPDREALRSRWLALELRRTVAGLMADITDAIAAVAASSTRSAARSVTGENVSERGVELSRLQDELMRLLRGLSPDPTRAPIARAAVEALARPNGALELVRAGVSRVGASRFAAGIAATRIRTLGALVASLLLDGIDDTDWSNLCAGAGPELTSGA